MTISNNMLWPGMAKIARQHLFAHRNMENIPTSEAALLQYVLRAVYDHTHHRWLYWFWSWICEVLLLLCMHCGRKCWYFKVYWLKSQLGEREQGSSTHLNPPSVKHVRWCSSLSCLSLGCPRTRFAGALCPSGHALAPIARLSGCSARDVGGSVLQAGVSWQQFCRLLRAVRHTALHLLCELQCMFWILRSMCV